MGVLNEITRVMTLDEYNKEKQQREKQQSVLANVKRVINKNTIEGSLTLQSNYSDLFPKPAAQTIELKPVINQPSKPLSAGNWQPATDNLQMISASDSSDIQPVTAPLDKNIQKKIDAQQTIAGKHYNINELNELSANYKKAIEVKNKISKEYQPVIEKYMQYAHEPAERLNEIFKPEETEVIKNYLKADNFMNYFSQQDIEKLAPETITDRTTGSGIIDSAVSGLARSGMQIYKLPELLIDTLYAPQNLFFEAIGKPERQITYKKNMKDSKYNPLQLADSGADRLNLLANQYTRMKDFDKNIFENIKAGDFAKAGEQLGYALIENLPQYITTIGSTVLTGNPYVGAGLLSAQAGAGAYYESSDNPNMTQSQKYANALGAAAMEGFGKMLGTVPILQKALRLGGAPVEQELKKGFFQGLKRVGKETLTGFHTEGKSEFITELGTNLIDRLTNKRDEQGKLPGFFDNAFDAYLVGGVMGAGMAGGGQLMFEKARNLANNDLQNKTNSYVELSKTIKSPNQLIDIAAQFDAFVANEKDETRRNIINNAKQDIIKRTAYLANTPQTEIESIVNKYNESIKSKVDDITNKINNLDNERATAELNKIEELLSNSPDDIELKFIKLKLAEKLNLNTQVVNIEQFELGKTEGQNIPNPPQKDKVVNNVEPLNIDENNEIRHLFDFALTDISQEEISELQDQIVNVKNNLFKINSVDAINEKVVLSSIYSSNNQNFNEPIVVSFSSLKESVSKQDLNLLAFETQPAEQTESEVSLPPQEKPIIIDNPPQSSNDENLKFSYSESPVIKASGIKAVPLEIKLNQLTNNWKNKPKIIVHQSINTFSEKFQLSAKDNLSNIEGAYYPKTNEIHLIADNLNTFQRAQEVLYHETFGHYGLREYLGDRFDTVIALVFKSLGADGLRDVVDLYNFDLKTLQGRKQAADEYLARLAEKSEINPTLWQRVLAKIRELLREIFPSLKFTDADIQYLLTKSRETVAGKKQNLNEIENSDNLTSKMNIENIVISDENWKGTAKELHKKAEQELKKIQGREIENKEQKWKILISRDGINKTLSNKRTSHDFQSTQVINKLIENSVLIKTEKDKKNRQDIKNFHSLISKLQIGNSNYDVRIIIKEVFDGQQNKFKFYLHELNLIKKEPSVFTARTDKEISIRSPLGTHNISENIQNVKSENKNTENNLLFARKSNDPAESDLSVYAKEQLEKENSVLLEAEYKSGLYAGFSKGWSKKTKKKDELIKNLKINLESEYQRGFMTGWDRLNKKAMQRYEYYRNKIQDMKDENLKKLLIQQIIIDYAKTKLSVKLRGPLLGWVRNSGSEINLTKAIEKIDTIAAEDNRNQLINDFIKFAKKFDLKKDVITYTNLQDETFTNAPFLKEVQALINKFDTATPTDETIGKLQNLKEEWIRQQEKQQSEIQDIIESKKSANPQRELYKKGLLWNVVKDIERLEKTPIRDLSYFDLKNLFDLIKNTYRMAELAGNFILENKMQDYENKFYELTAEVLEGAEIPAPIKGSLNTQRLREPIKTKIKDILTKLKNTKKISYSDLVDLMKSIPKWQEFKREFHFNSLAPETLVNLIGPKAHDFFFKQWNNGYRNMLDFRHNALDSFKNFLVENEIDLEQWNEYIDIDIGTDIRISKNDRLWFYVNSKNMNNIKHILGREFDGNSGGIIMNGKINFINPEQLEKLLDTVTDEEIKLGNFIFDYFDNQYNQMNEIFLKENGFDMPRTLFYFPIEVEGSELAQSSQQEKMFDEITQNHELFRASLNKGFTEHRIGAANTVKCDIWGQIYRNINTSANYIGYAMSIRNINKLLYDKRFQAAISAKFGKEFWIALAKHNKNIASEYKIFSNLEKTIGWFRKNYTTAILALPNVITPFKNYLSLFNAMARMDSFEVMKAFYKVQFYTPVIHAAGYLKNKAVNSEYLKKFIGDVKNSESEYLSIEKKWSELSPVIRERINMGFNKETRQIMLAKGAVQQIYNIKNIREILMSGIQYTDKKTTLTVAEAAYNIKMKELRNSDMSFTEKERAAVLYAEKMVRSTQPMSDALFLSIYQQGGAWEKLFTMFTSDTNRIYNMLSESGNFLSGKPMNKKQFAIDFFCAIVLAGIFNGIISRMRAPEEPEEIIQDVAAQTVAPFLFAGNLLGSAIQGYKTNWIVGQFIDDGMKSFNKAQKAYSALFDEYERENANKYAIDAFRDGLKPLSAISGLPLFRVYRLLEAFNLDDNDYTTYEKFKAALKGKYSVDIDKLPEKKEKLNKKMKRKKKKQIEK